MKRCNQCGTIVKDEARFCPNCGMSYFSSYDIDQTVSLNHANGQKAEDDRRDTDEQKTVYHGKTTYEETGEADTRYESGKETTGTWQDNVERQDHGERCENSDRYGTFSSQRYARNRRSAYSGQTSSDHQRGAGYQQNTYNDGSYSGRSSYTSQQEPKKNNVLKIVLCILAVVVVVWAILVLLLMTDTGEIRFFGLINGTEEISEEEMLDGTWSGYGDYSYDIYQSQIDDDSEVASYFKDVSLYLPITFTFHYNSDGVSTSEMSTDEEIVSQNIQEWYREGMEPYLEDALKQEGHDMTVEEYFELTGYSWEQAMEDDGIYTMIQKVLNNMSSSDYYTALEGVIYFSQTEDVSADSYDSSEIYELTEDNKLIFHGIDEENVGSVYPVTLYKQDE